MVLDLDAYRAAASQHGHAEVVHTWIRLRGSGLGSLLQALGSGDCPATGAAPNFGGGVEVEG